MSDVTPVRDPRADSLLTPQNAVLALIDYQPEQYAGVASVGHDELLAPGTLYGCSKVRVFPRIHRRAVDFRYPG